MNRAKIWKRRKMCKKKVSDYMDMMFKCFGIQMVLLSWYGRSFWIDMGSNCFVFIDTIKGQLCRKRGGDVVK